MEKHKNKQTVTIRGTIIGSGRPKICVPLVAEDLMALRTALEELEGKPWDLVEWRADFYREVKQPGVLEQALEMIRSHVKEKPLLFTFRTAMEGGNCSIETADYFALNERAAKSSLVDIVDVEIYRDERAAARLARRLHESDVLALGSNHDFEKTPSCQEMTGRLCQMQELGMDITKLAVMPKNRQDVLELLRAAVRMEEALGDRPCVTMSMGGLGLISRIVGSFSGSAITFGTVGAASAPGQISAEEMALMLSILSEPGN